MLQPGRQYSAGTLYRYGFNGQENSDEIGPNTTTAEFWEYDARIGRRWNIDPVGKEWESPYACFSNNPIENVDHNGNSDTATTAAVGAKLDDLQKKDIQLKSVSDRIKQLETGLGQLKSYFNQQVTMDIGMSWNVMYWIPELGNELVSGGSTLDYMASRIAYWTGELSKQVNLYNSIYGDFKTEASSLKSMLHGASTMQFAGTSIFLSKLSSVNKNSKSAEGSWRVYEILVDGDTFRFGIADATRLRKTGEFAGLPVRLAQQLSKIRRYAPQLNLNWEVGSLLKMTKAEGLNIESEVIRTFALKHGIPLGNVAEIAKWGELFGKAELSEKAVEILSKFLKF